jgi:hypothetical protein
LQLISLQWEANWKENSYDQGARETIIVEATAEPAERRLSFESAWSISSEPVLQDRRIKEGRKDT